MRVRIRRFETLRLRGQSGHAQLVEVRVRQHLMDAERRVVPPPFRAEGDGSCQGVRRASRPQLPVDRGTALPLLQVHLPQPMPNPLVHPLKDQWGFRQSEVRVPAHEV